MTRKQDQADLKHLLQLSMQEANEEYGVLFELYSEHGHRNAMLRKMQEERDFDPAGKEFSLKEVEKQLRDAQKEFTDDLASAKDVLDVYIACVTFMEGELIHLAYYSNDLPMARIHRDYFNRCLDKVLPALDDAGLLTDQLDEKFAELRPMFDLGLQSYEMMRLEILEQSDGETNSLMKYCQNQLAAQLEADPTTQSMGSPTNQDELSQHAVAAAWQLMHLYELQSNNEESYQEPPHPVMLLLGMKASELAAVEIAAAHPGADAREIRSSYPEEFYARRSTHVADMLKIVTGNDNYTGLLLANRTLNEKLSKHYGVPADFTEIRSTSLRAAELWVERQQPAIVDRFAADARVPLAAATSLTRRLLPALTSPHSLSKQWQRNLNVIEPALSRAWSVKGMGQYFEALVNLTAENVFFQGFHPGILLALQCYVGETRRLMQEEYDFRGMRDDENFRWLQQMERKCEYAYKSYMVTQDWMMEKTADSYDSLFVKSAMRHLYETGEDPKNYGRAEEEDIGFNAALLMEELQEQRGVPKQVRGNMFIPLLYETCYEIAEEQYERDNAEALRDARGYRDILATRKQAAAAAQPNETQLHEAAHALLQRALALMPTREEMTAMDAEIAEVDGEPLEATADTAAQERVAVPVHAITASAMDTMMEFLDGVRRSPSLARGGLN